MRVGRVLASSFLLVLGVVAPARAQESGPREETIDIYFDCQGSGCYDLDFFRREIPWVNWVRDRESADLHVLVTSQRTGGGGLETTLSFIGRGRFEGQDQTLVVHTSGDATQDEIRRAQASRLTLGLGRYLADTPMADRLRIVAPPGNGGPGGEGGARAAGSTANAQDDPWDFWVFRVGANGYMSGESSYHFHNLSTSISANRTTDAWKVTLSGRFTRRTETYELSDSSMESRWEDWNANGLAVKSVTAHASIGVKVGAGRSTSLNERFRWNVSPGVELNAFPYTESSRRSLTLQALVNVRHWRYDLETLFGQTEETRVAASLTSALDLVQPWGRVSVTLDHARYLHDTSKYEVSLGGFFEVRLFKGFSVNMYGSYNWIRDQLYLPLEGATDEEILVQQRQLATNFRYYTSFGISYRFGSIFNNVVNPRFGGGEGGQVFFF
jgi:hypothetical protein